MSQLRRINPSPENQERSTATLTPQRSQTLRRSSALGMKPWQWAILITEALLLCGVLGALVWLVLTGNPTQPQAVAQAGTATPAGPTLTPAPTLTPFVWPTPLPTRTPLPTSTRVVSRASVNQGAITKIEQQVELARQLKPRSTVSTEFLTRDEMLDYARRQYEADRQVPQELALYRALGLIQPDVQIDPDTGIKMVASNIAGFYNPQDKRLRVISNVENMDVSDKVTLAHEYAHALQDQYFDLAQYQGNIRTTDARLAMMALPEGDATVVMSFYLYGNTTRSDWEYLAYRASFSERAVITATGVSTRTGEIAYFPYLQGAQFVVALLLDGKGWTEVNHAYADPPQTTSLVLHPERYLTRHATPVPVAMPDLGPALGKEWTPLIKTDTLGEFITSVHLDEFLNDPQRAAQAADGWGGDSFTLWQASDERQLFAWQIAWDTPRDVGEFLDAYTNLLRKRTGEGRTVEREDANLHWYSSSAGSGLVSRSRAADRTLVLWGPDKATVEKLLAVFK